MKNRRIKALAILGFALGLGSCSSKPTDPLTESPRIPASGKMAEEKLPSVFHKHGVGTEIVQTNYCWIVKIAQEEPDLLRYFMPGTNAPADLSEADIGKFTVLGEIHYNGFGGDGYPKFMDPQNKAVSYDDALKILETDEDCTAW